MLFRSVVMLAAVGGGIYLVGIRLLGAQVNLRPQLAGGPRSAGTDA